MDVQLWETGTHVLVLPDERVYCPGRKPGNSIERRVTVNGQEVGNVLDTGFSQTTVHSQLVQSDKLLEEEDMVVRYVHGDLVFYPPNNVSISLEGHLIQTVAAVLDTLPTSVLL